MEIKINSSTVIVVYKQKIKNIVHMDVDTSIQFPLASSNRIVFTGHFNGYGVEINSIEEMAMLYHMGYFGKGTKSRSRPKVIKSHGCPVIMRKRQYGKRQFWSKKFKNIHEANNADEFLHKINVLSKKIIKDHSKELKKDIIDLISSDEDCNSDSRRNGYKSCMDSDNEAADIVVIVPNSDSEGDDYFEKFEMKSCLNIIKCEEKLALTTQEAFFLLYSIGCLKIVNNGKFLEVNECWNLFLTGDCHFVEKYVVYHYYRSKGYIVKPGIKFGGDYLIYRDGPGINHADFIVVIKFEQEPQNWLWTLGLVRMAASTLKEIIIIEVCKPVEEDIILPKDLCKYTVKELVLSRNSTQIINDSEG
ncbi:unnamed protein product [Leptidea sinapis]|uniref:tRNA-splicing endonuclease subunit Sen2 n=1 Tax=Leptidea sinapis TaxID=189913 RepID=A0A5E4QTZ0_9NEOP|nr:unnamed protein product [Leptidea sinapis]